MDKVQLGCLLMVISILSQNVQLLSQRDFELRDFYNSLVAMNNGNPMVIVPDESVQFFVLGDWGGLPVYPYRTIIEQAVSRQMVSMAKSYNTQFQLALGDNFYFDGVKDVEDKRFKETYEDVFTDPALDNPWFLLMGNHDHYGNAEAQIEYSKYSKRWMLPDYNYTINVTINSGQKNLIAIVMIDTVLLCGNSGHDFVDIKPELRSKEDKKKSKESFEALEATLKAISQTDVKYLIVAGHFPVWSISSHGPTECLVEQLRPLLHKYKVNAYFCGHDHNLQHITDTYMNVTVEHILSGASNFNDNSTKHQNAIPKGSLKFYWTSNEELLYGGMALVQANVNNMTITYFETTGKELYQTMIFPRKI